MRSQYTCIVSDEFIDLVTDLLTVAAFWKADFLYGFLEAILKDLVAIWVQI